MRPLSEIVPSANGSPDALDAGLVLGRLELLRLQLGESVLDGSLALGGVELLARRRREDKVQDAALFGGELRLDQVSRLLRVGAGDLELVAQVSAEQHDRQQEGKEGEDAHQQHTPRVGSRTYAPTGRARRLKVARRPDVLWFPFDSI